MQDKLNASERLAVLTALEKAVKREKAKAREEADAHLMELWDDDMISKRGLSIGGVKVGEHIIVMDKDIWEVTDRAALDDFALSYGFGSEHLRIKDGCEAAAAAIIADEHPELVERVTELDPHWQSYIVNHGGVATYLDSGLEVPGVRYRGETVKHTMVTGCKPEAVLPIVSSIGGVDALLLGDGESA